MRLKIKKRFLGRPLTEKELLTWRLIAQGLTSKEVAAKRGVSVGTIETVRSILLSKLGARNGPTLIAMWYQTGNDGRRQEVGREQTAAGRRKSEEKSERRETEDRRGRRRK